MKKNLSAMLVAMALTALPGHAQVLSFSGWQPLPDGATEKALGGAAYAGNIHIFATGLTHRIYEKVRAADGSWSSWNEVEGNGLTEEGPAAVAYGPDLFLFIKGQDARIFFNRKHGASSPWDGPD